jgi:radical SAM family uncharacterized protein
MLKLADVPILSKDRDEDHPIVMVGGPCAYNPEPLADFVDMVVLGEAEEVILEVVRLYKVMKAGEFSKQSFLEKAAEIPGVYIPSLYQVSYNDDGTVKAIEPVKEGMPAKVTKRIIENLDEACYPERVVLPYLKIVHDRVMLEVFRGCTRGCRFCQAGMIYRPVREKSVERLTELTKKLLASTGYEEISLASLSTSDYSRLQEIVRHLVDEYEKDRIGVSLPSLRLDNFTLELIEEIQKVRKTGLTFAPEAGTQRLRDVINKGLTEADLINAVEKAFGLGWSTVKLYFMISLPTETFEDVDGIADLTNKVVDEYYKLDKENRGKGLTVTVSASTFVPKPFTPFQWAPQDTLEAIYAKQKLLVRRLKRKGITFNYHDAKTSYLEAVFARGDRRLSKVLAKAHEMGCKFDGWMEYFDFDKWMQVFSATGINPDFYASRARSYEEVLPWEHIDVGVTKQFLIRENEKAQKAELTQDCRAVCSGCGINKGFLGGIC